MPTNLGHFSWYFCAANAKTADEKTALTATPNQQVMAADTSCSKDYCIHLCTRIVYGLCVGAAVSLCGVLMWEGIIGKWLTFAWVVTALAMGAMIGALYATCGMPDPNILQENRMGFIV